MNDQELKDLVDKYKPNPQVLEAMSRIKVVCTVGPSASGKTTVMKALVEQSQDFEFVLDETSRQPRAGEVDNVDFLFRTTDQIIADIQSGNLVQVALGPNGDFYCTRPQSYPLGTGLIALVPAAVKEFRQLPIGSFKAAFIVPATFELWQDWLNKQARLSNWTHQQLAKRLDEAKVSYEFALNDSAMKFVLNDNVNAAARRLAQVADSQAPSDEYQARQVAQTNYQKLISGI